MAINSLYSPTDPRVQIVWDPTTIREAMTCNRRYRFGMRQGWRLQSNAHANWGHMWHSTQEVFDETLAGLSLGGKMSPTYAKDLALAKALRHAHAISADFEDHDDGKKTRANLIRALCWYVDEMPADKESWFLPWRMPNGQLAIEWPFLLPLPITTRWGEPYMLCGTLDQITVWGGEHYIRERKTTGTTLGANYFNRYTPDPQIDTYDLVGWLLFGDTLQLQGVLLEAAQVAVNFVRFVRQPIYRTPGQREEWMAKLCRWLKEQEDLAIADVDEYNPAACALYGGCPFNRVCNKDPGVRHMYLKGGDYKQEFWNPLSKHLPQETADG